MEKRSVDERGKKLIGDITEKFLDPQRKHNTFFDYNLMVVLAFYLETRSIGINATRIESITESRLVDVRAVHDFFFCTILPEISDFARTDAENDALVMVLFEEVLGAVSRTIRSESEIGRLVPQDMMFFFEVDLMGFQ